MPIFSDRRVFVPLYEERPYISGTRWLVGGAGGETVGFVCNLLMTFSKPFNLTNMPSMVSDIVETVSAMSVMLDVVD